VPPDDVSEGEIDGARELGVYVHFPFCSVLCPYCDFAVDTRAEIPHDAYADAVIAELGARARWFRAAGGGPAPRLESVYFGGGTPGLWRVDALGRVLEAARQELGGEVASTAGGQNGREDCGQGGDLEITVEANPGELDDARLAALRAVGVNRLSLGIQSFDDRLLRAIGRNHDAAAGGRAVRAARAAGFDNLSLDLMFGLPGQSMEDWRRSLAAAIALEPEHVSAYSLTIERGTVFGSRVRAGTLHLPEADASAEMQIVGREALRAAGYAQYEVSSHARPGRRAIHNGLTWSGGAYLGLGASAASFRPLDDGSAWRFTNARATATYLRAVAEGAPPTHTERRTSADLENEAVWLALRTSEGIDRAAHARRFGADPLDVGPGPGRAAAAAKCAARGWLRITDARIAPTPDGLLFADEMASRLWV
jgi:oxygen-independent coproporphyrinogen-3 oxidase